MKREESKSQERFPRKSAADDGATVAVSAAVLERFLDGDLARGEADEVLESVRVDPHAASRLQRIKDGDEIARQALLGIDREPVAGSLRLWLGRGVIAGAFAAMLAIGPAAWRFWPGVGAIPAANEQVADARSNEPLPLLANQRVPAESSSTGIHVVFSLAMNDEEPEDAFMNQLGDVGDPIAPLASAGSVIDDAPNESRASVPTNGQLAVGDDSEVQAVAATTRQSSARVSFESAVSAGNLEMAAAAIASSGAAERESMYALAGGAVRSSQAAERLLEALPGEAAVDLCSAWLRDGTNRAQAIKHLQKRAEDAALRDRVHVALHDLLKSRPSLRSWMVSYAGWAVREQPPRKEKDRAMEHDRGTSALLAMAAGAIEEFPAVDRRG